jgi:hypothetical protein
LGLPAGIVSVFAVLPQEEQASLSSLQQAVKHVADRKYSIQVKYDSNKGGKPWATTTVGRIGSCTEAVLPGSPMAKNQRLMTEGNIRGRQANA